MKINDLFRKFAIAVSNIVGKPVAFFTALFLIVLWGFTGPIFGFSNRWQLVVNTGTTIVTLLMVFLIQNTQNRDSKAIHIKLDELLRSIKGASDKYLIVEEMPDEEIDKMQDKFRKLHEHYYEVLELRRKKRKKANKK